MAIKSLKKLNIKAMILATSACVFGMSVLLPTFSWFNEDTTSPISVDGNIHGSYFESGDGTAANPFEIARPIQLYYLSWLQEMGYFNEAVYDENTGEYVLKQQYHFYLSKDLDMRITDENDQVKEEYIIPPIGTIKYPFVGSFDGKGHIITDLTITNDYSDYTKDPRHPEGSNTHSDSYEILGLFGVLGTTEATAVVNSSIIEQDGTIHQLQVNNQNVLVSYTTAGNYVRNFYLDNANIIASSVDLSHALAGAVAGYSNATVTNVGIHGATLSFASGRSSLSSVGATNLSEYSTFGYVTDNYKRDVDLVNEKVYTPKATAKTYNSNSSGTAWGGSIDMAVLLKRIFKSQYMSGSQHNNVPKYPKKETYIYDANDNETHYVTYDTRAYSYLNGQNRDDCYYSSDKTANADAAYLQNESIGSYYWIDETGSSDHKAYVGGFSDIEQDCAKYVSKITYTSDVAETCYYIRNTNDNTGNYIGVNANGAYATYTSTTNAAKWHFVDNALSCIATINPPTTGYTGNDNASSHKEVFYLNYDGTDFSVGKTSTTTWTFSNGQFTASFTNRGYKINARGTSNYLSNSGTTIDTANASSAPMWTVDPEPADGAAITISMIINGTKRYFRYSNGLTLSTSSGTWTAVSASGDDYYLRSGTNRYLRYNNGWTTTTNANNRTAFTFTLTTVNGTANFLSTSTTDIPFTATYELQRSGQAGYVPLSVKGDDENVSPFNYNNGKIDINYFYTSPMNTGYIIGGYYDKYNGGASSSLNTDNFGDVRISQYNKNYVSTSYTWNTQKFTDFFTINDDCYNANGTEKSTPISFNENGVRTDNSQNLDFAKLDTAKENLKNTFTNNTDYVSGIHFMDSSISIDRTIKADKALINNKSKTDYEMPEDAIDFHLKEKGFINFFAGNYHNNNNSFFALHKIERYTEEDEIQNPAHKEDDIKAIKKIKYVFIDQNDKLDGERILLYDDNTWSDGQTRTVSKNSFTKGDKTFVFAFDTKWIGLNETLIPCCGTGGTRQAEHERIYYFEIPVNDGEYALGSCEGACGGYLIYLDISAASQKVNRKTLNEMFVFDTLSGEIPYGTQYIGNIPSLNQNYDESNKTAIVRDDIESINDLNSYYGSIDNTASGDYSVNRESNNNVITVTGDSALDSSYIGDGLTLSGDTLGSRTQRRIRRITDYDYNTITRKYIRQITTIEIIGSGNTAHNYATTTIEYNGTGFDAAYTLVTKFSYDWIGNGPNFKYSYYLRVGVSSNGIGINFQNNFNNDWYLTVEYLATGFTLTCGTNSTPVTDTQVNNAITNGTAFPQAQILVTSDNYVADKWYDFTKESGGYTDNEQTVDPNSSALMNLKYTRQALEELIQNFIYSDFSCLGNPTNGYTLKETAIVISNGQYIYEFSLSGSNPESTQQNPTFTIYYLGQGTFVIRMANGSEYILFVDESQQQNP